MSNTAVGPVYDIIIAEVINAVRVDFEENGVDDGALDDLKKVRLSPSPSPPLSCHCTEVHSAICLPFPNLRQFDEYISRFNAGRILSMHLFFRAIVSSIWR